MFLVLMRLRPCRSWSPGAPEGLVPPEDGRVVCCGGENDVLTEPEVGGAGQGA